MDDNPKTPEIQALERARTLQRQREEILAMPSENAIVRILESRQPAALVHSFPDEDLYFLIHDIGINDALPLLRLASDRQRDYIIDMAGWHRDRFQLHQTTQWLAAMFSADPDRVLTWLMREQTKLLELFLYRNIQVAIREHDQDPSVFGDEFFTHDDIYYIRILDDPFLSGHGDPSEDPAQKFQDDQRREFVRRLLVRLADRDHLKYQQQLVDFVGILPAEVEEEAYRVRNFRLGEKGFLPFDEAIGIYQPMDMEALTSQPGKSFGRPSEQAATTPVPLTALQMLQQESPFAASLQVIDLAPILEKIQIEFAALCNQIIAADQKPIQDKSTLGVIVEKACGYLNIGLETAVGPGFSSEGGQRAEAMAAFVRQAPLPHIFRVGYGRALELKWRVQRWRKGAWFEKVRLPLTFWGEAWLGVLGGLLLEKPLFYDNYRTGNTLYREFASLQDIDTADQVMAGIMAFDALLAGMAIECWQDEEKLLTCHNLVLTLWARDHLGLGQRGLTPLSVDEFKTFFKALFASETPGDSLRPGKTSKAMKADFLKWLSVRSARPPEEIIQSMGTTLEDLFSQVDEELGAVSPEDLDPRYIQLFLIDTK